MNLEFLKYGTGIGLAIATLVTLVKIFYINPKQIKKHDEKLEEQDEQLKNHSQKITILETNEKNQEKTNDRIHETLIALNVSIIRLTEKL